MNPYNYSKPDWTPLERAVSLAGRPKADCSAWMWMQEEPAGTHHYKHRGTRSYLRLTMDTPAPTAVLRLCCSEGEPIEAVTA